jgi:hypothetical protein
MVDKDLTPSHVVLLERSLLPLTMRGLSHKGDSSQIMREKKNDHHEQICNHNYMTK